MKAHHDLQKRNSSQGIRRQYLAYVPLGRGFLYLVTIMDWASRAVLTWRLSNTMDVSFCLSALEEALARFGTPDIFNADQGSQFTSTAFTGTHTEKSRLRRSLMSLQELMRQIQHHKISDQVGAINAALRGHYAYYGFAGNIRALFKVYRAVERYWWKMLRNRSWAGRRLTWDVFHQIREQTPLLRPKLRLPYRELQALAVL